MRILAIESSSLVASVAIMEDSLIVAEYTINYKKTHSQTLLPMIDEICRMIEEPLETVDAIAVSAGPGSFTGLRIGSATAKGLGLALKKPLIHVPTVEAMAYQFFDTDKYIVPIMDARRNQVYSGIYRRKNGKTEVIKEQALILMDEYMKEINQLDAGCIFLGDGVEVCRAYIEETAEKEVFFAPAQMNRQRAAAVAALGAEYYKQGRMETAAEHVPDYLRASQAERERMGKIE